MECKAGQVKVRFVTLNEWRGALAHLVEVYVGAYSEPEIAEYGELESGDALRYLKWLTRHSTFFCIALVEGKPVGFIVADASWVDYKGRCGEIHEWVVLPEFRRLGIGKQLFEKAIEHFKQKGIKRIGLWVGEGNRRALTIYQKMGFKETGRWGKWLRLEKSLSIAGG